MALSFDRAADYYDATRALPEDVHAALTAILYDELAGRGRCLEVGAGTGRIALPLHERGIRLIGADISPAMLARLIVNAGGRQPFPLILADATALPLAAGTVGAVLASHVLHLIEDWRAAVDEAFRVLEPGGVLLADFGHAPTSPRWQLLGDVLAEHGVTWTEPGTKEPGEVAAHLGSQAAARALEPVTLTARHRPEEFLCRMEDQMYSWTWGYEPDQLRRAAASARERAAAAGIALAEPAEVSRIIQWWAFERLT